MKDAFSGLFHYIKETASKNKWPIDENAIYFVVFPPTTGDEQPLWHGCGNHWAEEVLASSSSSKTIKFGGLYMHDKCVPGGIAYAKKISTFLPDKVFASMTSWLYHELVEAITVPTFRGIKHMISGWENADFCQFCYGNSSSKVKLDANQAPYNVIVNGCKYLIQLNLDFKAGKCLLPKSDAAIESSATCKWGQGKIGGSSSSSDLVKSDIDENTDENTSSEFLSAVIIASVLFTFVCILGFAIYRYRGSKVEISVATTNIGVTV